MGQSNFPADNELIVATETGVHLMKMRGGRIAANKEIGQFVVLVGKKSSFF